MRKTVTGKTIIVWIILLLLGLPAATTAQEKAWLGAQVQSLTPSASIDNARRSRPGGESGLMVTGVDQGSPAQLMGLRKGDVILTANMRKLASPVDLNNVVATLQPGEEIDFSVLRAGQQYTFFGRLMAAPQPPSPTTSRVPKTSISDDTEIFVQMGHTSRVVSVAFSHDGQFILGGDSGPSAMLWDTSTGKEIRSYKDFDGYITKVAFSPDGRFVLAGGYGGMSLKVWDFITGKGIWSVKGHANMGIACMTFSQDGRYVLSGNADNTMRLRDATSGKEIKTFTLRDGAEAAMAVALSPDTKHALSVGKDGILRLWDIASGHEIKSFHGRPGSVRAVAFSPDGRHVSSGTGKTLIKTWEIASGRETRSFSMETDDDVSGVSFSPDGKYVLSVGTDRVFRLWDLRFGKEIRTFSGHSILIYDTAFSSDSRYIASGSEDKTIKLWDTATGREIRTFSGNASWIYSTKFSPDGRQAVSASGDITVKQWDMAAGREIAAFPIHKSRVRWADFLPDGRRVLSISAGMRDNFRLWDTTTGKVELTLTGHASFVNAAAISPHGKYAISGGQDKLLKLWDLSSGLELKTFHGHTSEVNSLSFSPDAKFVLSADNSVLRLWELSTGREIRTFSGHRGKIFSAAFSPDGKYAVSGSVDKTIKLWNIATGQEIKTFSVHGGSVTSVAFSHDGRFISSGSGDNSVRCIETATGREISTFTGHSTWVNSVSFSPDDKYLLSSSFDGTTRLWDRATGKEMARFIGFNDGEWIVITPEGYYNSSPNGHKHLSIRMGNSIYGIDQFYDVFYRPDIVATRLKGEDISGLVTLTINEAIKNPPPVAQFTSAPSDAAMQPLVKVCYRAESTGGGIGEIRLFHNGKLIQSDGFYRGTLNTAGKVQLAAVNSKAIYEEMRSITIKGKAESGALLSRAKGEIYEDCREVEAVPGENEVSVMAFNSNNTVQGQMKTISFHSRLQPREPHLYVLSVGIDRYKDPGVNLKYAVKDARDIEDKLLRQSATIYKLGNIHHELLTDDKATKENITARIAELSRLVKPDDGFILFVAGHGVLLQNQYYMLTHDYNGQVSDQSLISSNEIVDMSKKIKSLHQLLIFDTCHAGGVDYIVSGLYDARISVLAKKMGLHIYASASDKQAAMDGYKGNGLFTYTLLDGLANNREADKYKDGLVSVVGLGGYSKKTTAAISKEIGHSQTPLIINFGKDYPLYKLP